MLRGLQPVLEAAFAGPGVLATVVRVEGSAYRRPGARMFFPDGGTPVGLVSGGCLEADLAERAAALAPGAAAEVAVYDMRSPDDIVWGLGLGCNGEVRVLLERTSPDAPGHLAFLADRLATRREGVLVCVIDGGSDIPPGTRLEFDEHGEFRDPGKIAHLPARALAGLAEQGQSGLTDERSSIQRVEVESQSIEAFVEYLAPVPRLLVFGAGADAQPMVAGAAALGWSVTLLDHRESLLAQERFAIADERVLLDLEAAGEEIEARIDGRTCAVVMTHHFLHDLAILEALAAAPPAYVALLGPRKRREKLLEELAVKDVAVARLLPRLHGPAGLDIGSETPEEIALSLLAEIRAVLSGRGGGFLRDRVAPLHDWPT